MNKVNFPIDKRLWPVCLIPGPVVLVTSHDSGGMPNIAPKSWVQMVSFEPSILMFSSSSANTTGRNILDTECFGINLVDSSIVSRVYQCISWSGSERIEKSGFTLTQASKISAPLVKESRAHLECSLYSYKDIGDNLVFFGEIVAASIWEEILRVEHAERYKLLDQVVFLENGIYSKVENSVRIDKGGR